jgi:hypothetical protein
MVVIIGDDNARRWPVNDERLINASFDGLVLVDGPKLVDIMLANHPEVTTIVIALGLNDAKALGASNSTHLTDRINQLGQMDSRILFTALPEFDCASVVDGANIVLINKTARKAFKDRFIPVNPPTAVDLRGLARPCLAYGPITGRNIYGSVATFLNNHSFLSPLTPPPNT